MDISFEEAYANYQKFLAKLDEAQDITEKNLLFRQLTEQLSELEHRIRTGSEKIKQDEPVRNHPESA